MEVSASDKSNSNFKKGLQSGVSIAIGYFPIALTFGLLSKTTGLNFYETVLMSLVVFAGASQYMSLSLLAAGTNPILIVLTTFIVNIRHLLMSASLNAKVEEEKAWKKAIYAFGITDETFSVMATKEQIISTGYACGVILISYLSWVVSSGIGFIIGAALPKILQEGMTVALYAMFIGLLVPSMKKSVKVVFLAGLAACFNSFFTYYKILETGWAIITSTILSAVIVEVIETIKSKREARSK
jgi:4-azaleucine resistance transporter AzlC